VFIVGSQAILASMPGATPEVRQSPEIDAACCMGLEQTIFGRDVLTRVIYGECKWKFPEPQPVS
jgi:hypothetical protein